MTKEQFQKIMTALETRRSLCEKHLGELHITDDIGLLTLAQAADLKNFCIAEEEIMTKICMVDLYHVIGMGNLTPIQMMKFTYAMQKYLSYRPTIKAIVKHLNSISTLPKLPVETQYKLQGLGEVTLVKGSGTIIDNSSVDDYNSLKDSSSSLPFCLDNQTIKVDLSQLTYFITIMTSIFKSPLSIDNFRQKLESHKEYLGITWLGTTDKEAIGTFKSNDIYQKVASYYRKCL